VANEFGSKSIGTQEWYDFIGTLSAVVPYVHLGGLNATRALVEMCDLDAESYVLDVGCGTGNTACLIAQNYNSRVMGIDLSEVMIAQAEKRVQQMELAGQVQFQVANIFQLPFEENLFDVAIAESVLTPLAGDKIQAMQELVRVIRAGGLIGINESTIDTAAPAELVTLMEEHPAIHGYFTPDKLRDLLESVGLKVTQMTKGDLPDSQSALKELGFMGFLSFMVKAYPKVLLKLLRDPRFRRASKVDDRMTRLGKAYMAYYLVVGQKP
jgi:arsenite methyltransferase